MPPPNRRNPQAVARLLDHNFPVSRFLSAEGAERLNSRLAELSIAGGAVYVTLVAAAVPNTDHCITLATRDARAAETGMRAALGNAQLEVSIILNEDVYHPD